MVNQKRNLLIELESKKETSVNFYGNSSLRGNENIIKGFDANGNEIKIDKIIDNSNNKEGSKDKKQNIKNKKRHKNNQQNKNNHNNPMRTIKVSLINDNKNINVIKRTKKIIEPKENEDSKRNQKNKKGSSKLKRMKLT